MNGPAVTAAPANGALLNGGGASQNSGLTPSDLNAFRISAVIDRLAIHIRAHRKDAGEFLNLCLSLARGIDFSIANHEVPNRSQELPSLVKEVCQNKIEALHQAAIMVLMISIKSACQSGWFTDEHSEELNNLTKEIATAFGSVSDVNTAPSSSLTVISTIMSRFYPRMKMGHIFTFLEVKPGFDAYVSDFKISKNLKSSPREKIRLFVAQIDSVETSSCLISPAKVNFLLNGRGVENRTTLLTDTGPQIPSIVTNFLKYGSNLLQAIGEFNGNYIIAVAFMSEMRNPDHNTLQDYEQLAPETLDSDSEVVVGKSRISLNCPISFKRITIPVKGHSCKHIQCFDFDNYVDINSRRPSWRCPHCNQHVCFTDIRMDQKMVKVLKDVGPNVSDIIFSTDGSWNAVTENDGTVQKPTEDKTPNKRQDESAQVLDLTQTDDAMDAAPTNKPQLTTQRETSLPDTMQVQQRQLNDNPSNSNEYGRSTSLPRNVSRTPVAAQGLPACSTSSVQECSTNNVSIPNNVSAASQGLHTAPASSTTPNNANPRQHPVIQQMRQSQSPQPSQQTVHRRVSTPQMGPHLRTPRPNSPRGFQSSQPSRISSRLSQDRPAHRPSGVAITTQAELSELIAAANRTMQMAVGGRSAPSLVNQRGNIRISSQPVTTSPDASTEMEWRPAGRMRGALSGQAYTDALNHYIIRPNQQAQAARPNSNGTSGTTQGPSSAVGPGSRPVGPGGRGS